MNSEIDASLPSETKSNKPRSSLQHSLQPIEGLGVGGNEN